jgi:L-amino acid N-acyltransferase YncA
MIRPARPDDAGQIEAFWTPMVRDTTVTFTTEVKSVAEIAALADGPDPFLVWDDGGTVLGLVRSFPFRSGPGYAGCVEHTVILAPAAAGRGIGRALMAALCEAAKAQGKHVMIACVSAENAAGVAFHEAVGFTPVGRMPGVGTKFGRFIDLVILQKHL